MKVRSGHIPSEVTYIFSVSRQVTQTWDDADEIEDEKIFTNVTPAICLDAGNDRSIAVAMMQTDQTQQSRRDNLPMSDLRIISLDYRGQEGRIFKFVTPDGFFFAIHQDILLDSIIAEGISPGGILNGKYLWARVGLEMKLIREKSPIYYALLEAGERALLSTISRKKLAVGSVYETKSGDRGLFLGFVDTWDYKLVWPNGKNTWGNRHLFSGLTSGTSKRPNLKPRIQRTFQKRQMLWFHISPWMYIHEKVDPTQNLLNNALLDTDMSYHFQIKKSHAMVKEVVKGISVPADIVEVIRKKAVNTFSIDLAQRQADLRRHGINPVIFEYEEAAANAMKICLLRLSGEAEPTLTCPELLEIQMKLGQELPVS